ncbi:MBL fold metallo-hydrolase [Halobaculum sp. P14]|uniref:MBL fold metallo-hydrolase n=1 Tax=Halobaculum sp. P14 TaxID=3421638 RepID=UPI003EBE908A
MADGGSVSVTRLEFPMDWPPGHVAAFLVDADERILVDAGLPNTEASLRDGLAAADLAPADVDHVVVTHPHPDHTGQIPTLLDAGDPTVHAPASAVDRLNRDADAVRERSRANLEPAGLPEDQLDEAAETAVASLERARSLLPPDSVDDAVDPGEPLRVGGVEFDPVHTPGHQADHLCYAATLGGDDVLFSGDMVLLPFRSALLHDGYDDGYREAVPAFSDALDALAARDVDRTYPGHGDVHARFAETVTRDRAKLNGRVDKVEAAVADGNRTVAAVVDAIQAGHDVRYVLPETMNILAHLVDAGRVERTVVDGTARYTVD